MDRNPPRRTSSDPQSLPPDALPDASPSEGMTAERLKASRQYTFILFGGAIVAVILLVAGLVYAPWQELALVSPVVALVAAVTGMRGLRQSKANQEPRSKRDAVLAGVGVGLSLAIVIAAILLVGTVLVFMAMFFAAGG